MLFVNPYTWSPNEAITSQKLNYLGQYLTTFLNGANISPSQLSASYSNHLLTFGMDIPPGGGFLAAAFLTYYPFTLPAANWNFVVEKVAVTCFNIVGAGASVTADITNAAGVSVLVGAAPAATVSLVEAANTNTVTLASGNQYLVKLTAVGTGVQAYTGVTVAIFGKMLLRS